MQRDDYISQPKPSGYRGIHLVYRFCSTTKPSSQYNGLKIEIQLRSQFQHAWATTVETVGTFLGEALKSSIWPDDWLRFFALAGSAVAVREKEPAFVPDTPSNSKDLIDELRAYEKKLNVANHLSSYTRAIYTVQTSVKEAHYFLLELNKMTKRLDIKGFPRVKTEDAQKAYVEAEKLVKQILVQMQCSCPLILSQVCHAPTLIIMRIRRFF